MFLFLFLVYGSHALINFVPQNKGFGTLFGKRRKKLACSHPWYGSEWWWCVSWYLSCLFLKWPIWPWSFGRSKFVLLWVIYMSLLVYGILFLFSLFLIQSMTQEFRSYMINSFGKINYRRGWFRCTPSVSRSVVHDGPPDPFSPLFWFSSGSWPGLRFLDCKIYGYGFVCLWESLGKIK